MRRQLPGRHKSSRLFRDSERELAREQAKRRLRRRAPDEADSAGHELIPPAEQIQGQAASTAAERLDKTPSGSNCCRVDPEDLVHFYSGPEEGLKDNQGQEVPPPAQATQDGSDWPFEGRQPEAAQLSNQATPDTPSSLFFGELATAYVPWQTFGQTLSLREALRTGTLFPELVRNVPLYQKPPGT